MRIILAKAGLDGHDRGIKVLVKTLRDAGMEVIYMGLYQTPEMIVNAAIQEDVDVVGISILSGAHTTLFAKIMTLLNEAKADHISVIGGGIIPKDDIPALEEMGVKKVFLPGAPTEEIINCIKGMENT
ncbi:MAG: cobalamin B12-binding domain-containing protein [Kiritimatiellae bacterium]|nr:cobalamin B12-binding domain-containing protein [Kiritimatiellia bacterium]